MTRYIISILPIFLYLIFLYALDIFSVIRKKRLAVSFLWGGALAISIYFISAHKELFGAIIPFAEEIAKYAFVVYLVKRNKAAFLSDSLTYGASVGAGFSLVENFLYASFHSGEPLLLHAYRGFTTSLMHISSSGVAAALLIIFTTWGGTRIFKRFKWAAIGAAIIPSTIYHYLHNYIFINNKFSLLISVIFTIGTLILLINLNERHIHSWIENSLGDEVKLASAFKAQNFSTTEAGKYLLSVKEQFNPLIFFDMVVYVNLYLELSITAKSFLMMKEYGVEIPQEKIKKFKENGAEALHLRKTIGKASVYTLSPIVNSKQLTSLIHLFD